MLAPVTAERVDAVAAFSEAVPLAARDRALARKVTGIVLLAVVLGAAVVASLFYGANGDVTFRSVFASILDYDSSNPNHIIVREFRMARTLVGIMVGAALGVTGALMQAVTRNPLADPGILGVNAGASFVVVLAIWLLDIGSVLGLVWFAFVGAAISFTAVYLLGSIGRGGTTPVRLALAGMALSSLLYALTRAVTLFDQNTLDQFRFWAVGSLAGREDDVAWQLLPFVAVGLLLALGVSRPLNGLALGEDTAVALGVKVGITRAVSGVAIMLLGGAAVAAAGPVGFVGLVVPHVARAWFGPDQRWLIPACVLLGPVLMLIADTLGRVIDGNDEVEVGIMTACLGGPLFVVIVRRLRTVTL